MMRPNKLSNTTVAFRGAQGRGRGVVGMLSDLRR